MSAQPIATPEAAVLLTRPDAEGQDYPLRAGATLADLLREAQIDLDHYKVTIDGRDLEELVPLKPRMAVNLVKREPPLWDWRGGFGMFRDDPAFEEMMKAVEENRLADRDDS